MSDAVLRLLTGRFPDAVIDSHAFRSDETAVVKRENLVEIVRFLRDDPAAAFDMPIDVTCVDFQQHPGGLPHAARFEVVYHFRSTSRGHRIRLKVPVPENDAHLDSVAGLLKGVVWFEREVFDMFGIRFDGHPDLRRILLYPEFVGHPLRKDYPVRGYQPPMDMPTLKGDPVPGLVREEE